MSQPDQALLRAAIMIGSLGSLILLPTVASSQAAQPVTRHTVSLTLANELADAAIAQCQALGREAVVAVVDRGGNLVALQRGDDIGPHNTIAAQRKAFTALSTKTGTSTLAARAQADPSVQNLTTLPELLLLGGGLPLIADGEVIGGIGVAGSGSAANDDSCTAAAISRALPVPPGN